MQQQVIPASKLLKNRTSLRNIVVDVLVRNMDFGNYRGIEKHSDSFAILRDSYNFILWADSEEQVISLASKNVLVLEDMFAEMERGKPLQFTNAYILSRDDTRELFMQSLLARINNNLYYKNPHSPEFNLFYHTAGRYLDSGRFKNELIPLYEEFSKYKFNSEFM